VTAAGLVPDFDTVILAGGDGTRMGGPDKPGLLVGGTPMLVSVARAAAAAGTSRLIVVGPLRSGAVQDALTALAARRPGSLACVREEPPGQGPVAGLRRGFAEVSAPWLVLLAADLPFVTGRHLTGMLSVAVSTPTAGVVLADADGRPQWLSGCWRASQMRVALASYGGKSLHGLLAPLSPVLSRLDCSGDAMPPWLDCDTPDDLAAARRAWLANEADSADSGGSR
jgi:molybdopterin-guanine dinucleotide biosynthesis protein A